MPEMIDRRAAFNGGELSPWMDARIDSEKYHMGCKQLQNMDPAIYGGAVRRPGTVYLGEAKTATTAVRLIPFCVNSAESYLLEFSALVLRVWNANTGALIAGEITTPYAAADIGGIQYVQQNNVMWLAHASHAPRKVVRTDGTNFYLALVEFAFPPVFEENITDTMISAAGATITAPAAWSSASQSYAVGEMVSYVGRYYACKLAHVSANVSSKLPSYTGSIYWTAVATSDTATAWSNAVAYKVRDRVTNGGVEYVCIEANTNQTPAASSRYWQLSGVTDASVLLSVGRTVTLTATANLFSSGHVGSQWVIRQYRDDLVVSMFLDSATTVSKTEPIFVDGEWSALISADAAGSGKWWKKLLVERSENLFEWEPAVPLKTSVGQVQALVTGNEDRPCFLRVRLIENSTEGTDPTNLKVELQAGNPIQTGVVQITEYTSATSVKAVVIKQLPGTVATKRWNAPAFSSVDGYPRAVVMHDGRLWFGGTSSKPTTLWASGADLYDDFRIGTVDSDAISYTIAADENSVIEWLVSQEMLIIGTASGEWVYGQRVGEDLPKMRRNTAFGSAAIQARLANDSVIFVQKSARKIREYVFALDRDGYVGTDLCQLAEHLGNETITRVAIQKNPETIIWCTTSTGVLLRCTYDRKQNVVGWCRYVTDGQLESLAVVPAQGEEDEVWMIVIRTIGGSTKRYVEKLATGVMRAVKSGTVSGMVFADSAVVRTGSPTTTITGLSHLNGKTVCVIGDGLPQADKVVSGGSISISSASTVIVGLPFTSILEPTYLEQADAGTPSKAGKKRLHRVVVEFFKSAGMTVCGDRTTADPVVFPVSATYGGAASDLFSGLHEQAIRSGVDRQASVIIQSDKPQPLNVMSLSMRYQLEAS